jgi:hypothetical protein
MTHFAARPSNFIVGVLTLLAMGCGAQTLAGTDPASAQSIGGCPIKKAWTFEATQWDAILQRLALAKQKYEQMADVRNVLMNVVQLNDNAQIVFTPIAPKPAAPSPSCQTPVPTRPPLGSKDQLSPVLSKLSDVQTEPVQCARRVLDP